ncbi:dipeptide ABC transporter ATP-binding protein [Chelatococcus sp. SYSU_G07232]|uniref:Dipeptide ABC transporter ATP-binding protein n=1 Tax=Chelatococcus albus TaxID=3047466 RepID=A0ABT7AID3_9HYPH|nr:dipeptide ABC transporter ATP-binding protein [Chelatococcus sp. SYSU_G07232]MDJ1159141.1 dipeptide ABC transporter ATP-binding protein [Chelatococcus sp. SYSU_G07232]
MALLDIRNLDLNIYGVPVLRGVSLSIAAGETLGLVGESGSGKSMTALATMQLLPRGASARGSIRLDGEELIGRDERAMCALRGRDISMVFQEPMTALNPLKTVGAQVSEVFRLHLGAPRAECDAWASQVLERVGLPPARYAPDRYPHELSGGQRQRVVIAMAVALKPKLLIADEPTTALDVTTQAQILTLMRALVAEDGASLLLITHDLAVVAETADRVAVMRRGEVVEEGETAAFFGGMTHPYSRALLEASTHVPQRRPRVAPGTVPGTAPAAREGGPILVADGVVREYRGRRAGWFRPAGCHRAVDAVTLSVAPGESVGLVGESGCGKSTLARTLLALEAPQGGRILFRGRDVSSLDAAGIARLRRDVQVVFQDPYGSFDPRHKAGRLVAEPLHLLRGEIDAAERDRRIARVLSDVGLRPEDAEKYPHEFSGGQRQRLAIARALITRPALIVLDEPVSALDVSIRAQVLDLLAELQARHALAYLFISHDLAVVRAITDRVLVMRAGIIVEQGPTAAVLDAPQHDYTRTLVAASPDLARALAERRTRAMPAANGRSADAAVPSA